jgi:hypothetical protein
VVKELEDRGHQQVEKEDRRQGQQVVLEERRQGQVEKELDLLKRQHAALKAAEKAAADEAMLLTAEDTVPRQVLHRYICIYYLRLHTYIRARAHTHTHTHT